MLDNILYSTLLPEQIYQWISSIVILHAYKLDQLGSSSVCSDIHKGNGMDHYHWASMCRFFDYISHYSIVIFTKDNLAEQQCSWIYANGDIATN